MDVLLMWDKINGGLVDVLTLLTKLKELLETDNHRVVLAQNQFLRRMKKLLSTLNNEQRDGLVIYVGLNQKWLTASWLHRQKPLHPKSSLTFIGDHIMTGLDWPWSTDQSGQAYHHISCRSLVPKYHPGWLTMCLYEYLEMAHVYGISFSWKQFITLLSVNPLWNRMGYPYPYYKSN